MKLIAIIAAAGLAGCATQHLPPAADIENMYIDCYNRASFERMYAKELMLTDSDKIESDSRERRYYAAIKNKLWKLRSTCK